MKDEPGLYDIKQSVNHGGEAIIPPFLKQSVVDGGMLSGWYGDALRLGLYSLYLDISFYA